MTMEWAVIGMTRSIKSRNVFRFIDVNDAMKLGLVAGVWSFASIGSLLQEVENNDVLRYYRYAIVFVDYH